MHLQHEVFPEQESILEASVSQEILQTIDDRISASLLTSDQKRAIIEGANRRMSDLMRNSDINVFDEIKDVEEWLSQVANTQDAYQERRMTPVHMQSLGYFSAALFETLQRLHRSDSDKASELGARVYEAYFTASPAITSYVGANAELELLSYARRTPATRYFQDKISGEIIYNGAFASKDTLFDELIASKSPIAQAELIQTVTYLAEVASHDGEWAESFTHKTHKGLELVASDQRTVPFVRLLAQSAHSELQRTLSIDYDEFYDLYDDYDALWNTYSTKSRLQSQVQLSLHSAAPLLDESSELVQIAPKVVASFDGRQPDLMQVGDTLVSLADLQSDNAAGLTVDQAFLLRTLHGVQIKPLIESRLGLALESLDLDVQISLANFMIHATAERYDRLSAVMSTVNDTERHSLANVFLATEFGDEFGDQILSIVEHARPEQSVELFEIVNRFRRHSKRFSQWFSDFDSDLAHSAERAINERFTDALFAIEKVAREGSLSVDTAPQRHNEAYEHDGRFDITITSLDEAITILRQIDATMSIMSDVVTAPDVHVSRSVRDNEWYQIYRFSSYKKGEALLHVRPYGSSRFDERYEYGNRDGVEATVSFVVNPANPYALGLQKDENGVSLRFDREGRQVHEAPDSSDRHPIRQDGTISVDLSSIMGRSDTTSVRIGRLVAAGNLLRAQQFGTTESLHHNTNYFDQQKYGDADGFASFAQYVQSMAEAMIRSQQDEVRSRTSRRLAARAGQLTAKSAA